MLDEIKSCQLYRLMSDNYDIFQLLDVETKKYKNKYCHIWNEIFILEYSKISRKFPVWISHSQNWIKFSATLAFHWIIYHAYYYIILSAHKYFVSIKKLKKAVYLWFHNEKLNLNHNIHKHSYILIRVRFLYLTSMNFPIFML